MISLALPNLTRLAYPLARALLFTMDAERAHHFTLDALHLASRLRLTKLLFPGAPITAAPVECMGLKFPNRVGLGAGLDKTGGCIDGLGAMGFGFLEIGTLTPRPQPGNPQPRLFRIIQKQAIINRMGFNNPGIAQGVAHAAARTYKGILGINIGKNFDTPNEKALDDYINCLRAAWPVADYVAVNLSSPNTKGLRDLQQEDNCRALIRALKQEQGVLAQQHQRHVPVTIKIAPDLEEIHIRNLARIFMEEGLEGVIATNTTISRLGVEGLRHGDETGGLSGAPVTAASTRVIRILAEEFRGAIPIIGVGGIMDAADAVAKLEAGACLLQIYTGLIYRGPELVLDVIEAADAYFEGPSKTHLRTARC